MTDIYLGLKQLCDAFNEHSLDKIMAHFADDCVLEMPRGNQPWGHVPKAVKMYEKPLQPASRGCRMFAMETRSTLSIKVPARASRNGP